MLKNNFLTANWNAPKNIKTLITTKYYPIENNSCDSNPSEATSYTLKEHSTTSNHKLCFNLATHVNDDINIVMKNRDVLNQFLPSIPYWLLQTHNNNVLEIDKIGSQISEYHDYDASITNDKNKICVVLTADCIPILLTDQSGSFVASIHAGRVGIEKNIIKNTIQKCNSKSTEILAYIGPAICAKHYEVGADILEKFKNLDTRYSQFFTKKTTVNKFDLDLNGIAVMQLLDCGLSLNNIYHSNICTYCNSDKFYSYRKNNHTGRFASLIWIE